MNTLLNIRFIYGNCNYTLEMNLSDTILDLKTKILKTILEKIGKNELNASKLDENSVVIKMGFPPMTIEGEKNNSKSLSEMKISNNEQLRVELKEGSGSSLSNIPISGQNDKNYDPVDYSKYSIYRKVIAADNSCLFNGINYAVNQCLNEPGILRELIAVEIQSNPDLYNEAILDKDPFEYCDWIMRSDTWGGGIELAILSKTFQVRIGVADVTTSNIEYIGENYSNIIYLLYDGIHYDVFVRKDNEGKENGVFLANDEKVKNEIQEILRELKKMNKFVDTANYKIKCNVCYEMLKGNEEALGHSKKTGHINFVQL